MPQGFCTVNACAIHVMVIGMLAISTNQEDRSLAAGMKWTSLLSLSNHSIDIRRLAQILVSQAPICLSPAHTHATKSPKSLCVNLGSASGYPSISVLGLEHFSKLHVWTLQSVHSLSLGHHLDHVRGEYCVRRARHTCSTVTNMATFQEPSRAKLGKNLNTKKSESAV